MLTILSGLYLVVLVEVGISVLGRGVARLGVGGLRQERGLGFIG